MRAILRYMTLFCALFFAASHAHAQIGPAVEGRYASIAVDADSREILHARQIDALRYPASLTKMMTLYLVFDAIEAGQVSLDDKMTISANASAQPPVKLGLRAGQKLRLHDAVQALAVKSSNDVAVALAEHLAGSEEAFARAMTDKARALGMDRTTYRNASGLPDPYQVTTARDQAKLADNLLRVHRRHYHYFGKESFRYKGRTLKNHNTLLGRVAGVDGFKTGYTRDSGYNLTISAQRGGRRIIAVVLGGASGSSRDRHMEKLVDRAFDVIGQSAPAITARSGRDEPSLTMASATPRPVQAFTLRGKNSNVIKVVTGGDDAGLSGLPMTREWRVHLGDYPTPRDAEAALQAALIAGKLKPDAGTIRKTQHGYGARLTGLQAGPAQTACAQIMAAAGPACFLIAPSG